MWLSLMKPITLRPVSCSISRLTSFFHDHLPAVAQFEHCFPLAGVRECLLGACEGVLQYDEDAVGAECGFRLCGAATGRPGQRPDHGGRDLGG